MVRYVCPTLTRLTVKSRSNTFSTMEEHSTFAKTVGFPLGLPLLPFEARICLAVRIPTISGEAIRPLLSTITERSPSASKPTPKSAFCFATRCDNSVRLCSSGSGERLGNVGSTSHQRGTTSYPHDLRAEGADKEALPLPQSTTTLKGRERENFSF